MAGVTEDVVDAVGTGGALDNAVSGAVEVAVAGASTKVGSAAVAVVKAIVVAV